MKWTKIASKLFQAIHDGDKETEQKMYAKMDEKKAKKKAKKEAIKQNKENDVLNQHIM
jgi:hypothetical protein